MCGLSGYSGSTVANVDKLKLLMWDNIDRGRQSCGLYGFGLKVFKAQMNPEEFISQPGFARQANSKLVLMHNRAPSGGMQTGPEGTHPFLLGTKDDGYIIGAHNGTLIEDSYEQIKKRNKDSGLFKDEEKVDSLSLFRYLLASGFDWSKLNEIYGHMALTWIHDGALFVYRRHSRPLYFGRESAKRLWYSSKEEGLKKIGLLDDDIEEVEPFILHKIVDGVIVEKTDLGKPAINLKGGYITGWRHHAEESREELNKIFPEKTYVRHHSAGSNWKPKQQSSSTTPRTTRGQSANIGRTFEKPAWMPDHVGKSTIIKGDPAFTVKLSKENRDVKMERVEDSKDALTKLQARVNLKVTVDQNGKLKRLPHARIYLARYESFGNLIEVDNIKCLHNKTNRLDDHGEARFNIPPAYTGEKVFILITNPNLKGLYYYFETPEILTGGREFKITATFPFFQQENEELGKFRSEESEENYSISVSESTKEIDFNEKVSGPHWEVDKDGRLTVKDIKPSKDDEERINEELIISEEAYKIKQKDRWGDDYNENQKKMLLANKAEVLSAFEKRAKEADALLSEDVSKMKKEDIISFVKKTKEYIKEDKERLERDRDIFKRNIV